MRTRTLELRLEELERRDCPAPIPTLHAGVVESHPEVTNVYVGTAPNQDAFTNVLVNQYLPLLWPYGVGQGSYEHSYWLPDPGGVALNNQWIQQQVDYLVNSGLVTLDSNTAILFYLPRNISDPWAVGEAASHTITGINGNWVPYAIIPEQNGTTVGASHELAEIATRAITFDGWGWYADGHGVNSEICDLAGGNSFLVGGFAVASFVLPNGVIYFPGVTYNPTTNTSTTPVNSLPPEWNVLSIITGESPPNFLGIYEEYVTNYLSFLEQEWTYLWDTWAYLESQFHRP